MASARTSSSDGDAADTPNQFDVFKATIRGKFNRLHLKLTEKEQELLDDVSSLQQEYEGKRLEINSAIQQIENCKLQIHNLMKSNLIEKERNEQLMTLDERIKQLNHKKNNINLAISDLGLIGSIEGLEEVINGIHVNTNISDPVTNYNLFQRNEAQEQRLPPDMDRRHLDRDQEFPGRQGHMGDMHHIMNPNNKHIDPMQNEMNVRVQRMMASAERAGVRNMQGRQDDQMIGFRPDDPRYAGSQRNQTIGFQDHRNMRQQFMDPQMEMRGRMPSDAEMYQMRMIEQQMAMMRMRDLNVRMQMFGSRNVPPRRINPELMDRMEHNINPETDNISKSEDLIILIREYKALNKSQEPIVPNQYYEFPQNILEAAKSCVNKKDDIAYKYEILPNIYDIILTCLQKDKSVTQVKESFKAMSIYPLCLYLDPRRPEFHTLRRHTGYFTYKISEIVDMSQLDYIFSKMGYSYDKQNEVYQFNPPQNQQAYSEHICRVGCELLIAIEELSHFEDIAPPGIDPIRHFVIKSQSLKNSFYQIDFNKKSVLSNENFQL